MEQKATLAMSAFSLGQSVRSIGNFLQGLIGLGESTAILVKNADEAALAGAKETKAGSDVSKGVTNPEIPKLDRPLIPEGMTQSQFGKDVVGWGARPEGALRRLETINPSEVASMQEQGLTREMATQWKDFYSNEFSRNANNITAKNRVELMRKNFR